jgi:ferric-dicitrate binding protein FerR (iron transport regulator)
VSWEDHLLREGLQVAPLSETAMSRIRAAAESEWRANFIERRPRRWLPYAAAAVLLAVLSMGGVYFAGSMGEDHGEPAARLVRSESAGVVEVHTLRQATPLVVGSVVKSARRYRANGQALFELEGGGNLRVAAGSEFEIVARNVVRLASGELYLDIPPGAHASAAFVVRTPAGEFRHVGTQFALAIIRGETRLRVREGSVHWLAAGDESTVGAGTEVLFSNGSKTVVRPIDTSGKEWDWTASTTPDFEIDNRPLAEFLEWVARESGRMLTFADDQARTKAATIRMHGSVHGLTPMQALSAVMAATELRFDLPDGQIRVSMATESTPRN